MADEATINTELDYYNRGRTGADLINAQQVTNIINFYNGVQNLNEALKADAVDPGWFLSTLQGPYTPDGTQGKELARKNITGSRLDSYFRSYANRIITAVNSKIDALKEKVNKSSASQESKNAAIAELDNLKNSITIDNISSGTEVNKIAEVLEKYNPTNLDNTLANNQPSVDLTEAKNNARAEIDAAARSDENG